MGASGHPFARGAVRPQALRSRDASGERDQHRDGGATGGRPLCAKPPCTSSAQVPPAAPAAGVTPVPVDGRFTLALLALGILGAAAYTGRGRRGR